MTDDYLNPDEIINPDDHRRARTAGFYPIDIDSLAQRAVDSFLSLIRRAIALAGGVLIFTVIASICGYALGLAALSGGIRAVWAVVGGFFAVVAVGMVIISIRRLRTVRKNRKGLIVEMKTLIEGDRQNERVVVKTVQRNDENLDVSIVQCIRGVGSMQTVVRSQPQNSRQIASTLKALITFPALMTLAALSGVGFVFLSLLFLIALAI